MNTIPGKTERLHAFDSLRGIMMLLGLVLHTSLTYNVTVHEAWMLKDPNSSHIISDFLVFLIHSFRMPIFFIASGFFGALLYYERKLKNMIYNRLTRITLPFIVFLLILWPAIVFTFSYSEAVFAGQKNPFQLSLSLVFDPKNLLPQGTFHLWFLYYLTLTTGATLILTLIAEQANKLTDKLLYIFDWCIQRPILRVIVYSTLIFIVLSCLNTSMVEASISLIPEPITFVYYLLFYITGWLFFKSKQHLKSFKRYDWASTILALLLAILQGLVIQNTGLESSKNSIVLIAFSSVVVSLFMFGILGLFFRYGSNHSARMRYLSDSSYWVYLIHLPIAAALPGIIFKYNLPAFIKLILVLSSTSLICFTSYHYLVRNTFIGNFLNGKKYSKKLKAKQKEFYRLSKHSTSEK